MQNGALPGDQPVVEYLLTTSIKALILQVTLWVWMTNFFALLGMTIS
jgi:hypothetical protein